MREQVLMVSICSTPFCVAGTAPLDNQAFIIDPLEDRKSRGGRGKMVQLTTNFSIQTIRIALNCLTSRENPSFEK